LTGPEPNVRPEPGRQAERTTLAWTRTSFAVLANGALLVVKDLHAHARPLNLIAAGLAIALALATCVIGIERQRTLARRPLPQDIAPRRSVRLIGISLIVLIGVTAIALAG